MQALAGKQLSAGLSRPSRGQLVITSVATPSKAPTSRLAKRSKVEIIKENSDYLRHPLMEELVNDKTYITEDSVQLMKFHGSYQQDHREKRSFGSGKAYMFMMRTRQPSGIVPNRLYLVMDELADKFGNGTLRLTTRQAYQLHAVLKHDLKTVFSTVIKNMGSTLGACGDVNRNVMGPAAPYLNKPEYVHAQKLANDFADLLAPQSGAYYDVWLDGEKFVSVYKEDPKVTADRAFNGYGTNFENSPEPIYGAQFLPRKFKIAVTVPGDNSVDLFTNDLGVIVISDDKGEVKGYNLVVGGGMGRTHRDEDTFPRLADPLGYVDKDDIFHAVKAVVATQRDYGRRDNRKQARLKYLLSEWGVERFRSVVEQYMGKKFSEFVPMPTWEYKDYLGWGEQGNGKLFYGIYIQNGRIKGEQKKALRAVIEKFELPVTLTPHQNIILRDVDPANKDEIMAMLRAGGVQELVDWDSLDRMSMACPALPLCGLAVTEAERSLPDINKRIRAMLTKVGLPEDQFLHVRMTGCPNGCARPYMAELGFVGDGPNSYQIWLGGNSNQTRLAELYADRVKVKDLESFLEPIFAAWLAKRRPNEGFGDWTARTGFAAVKQLAATTAPTLAAAAVKNASGNGNGNGAAPAGSDKQLTAR
ncbi:hypothetical protein Vretifemale_8625 [Volvox reticuliferus]|uniref:assimilatory sulfite reductase (ferredoxin) n=2 Tax=Volvox reticuliferus TaxID=1737510 RepID=A0A8J4CCW2_9CHLO|nr:hypothetical protein Vretifemale_8625 [Volvox reticuliferus]